MPLSRERAASTAYLDDMLRVCCIYAAPEAVPRWTIVSLPADSQQQRNILGQAPSGYVVTGGGHEPIYNGAHIVPLATEVPTDRVELVQERAR